VTAAIVADGLTKRYGAVTALRQLNLEVPQGAVFGLLGPNGAGKSTTFGILCGWLAADAGYAQVLGVPSRELSRLRGKVSAMPQDAAFPPQVSVRCQLAFYARLGGLEASAAAREVERVLSLVELSEVAPRHGNQLSHGMLKRVALAQALLGSPEVILLDEPTAGLDPASARHIKDVIAAQAPRATVVISSHNLAEIQEICSHGAILAQGARVASGTIAELTRRGTEITIELGSGRSPPLEALRAAPNIEAVELTLPQTLRIVCAPNVEASLVIGEALRILLDDGAAILGVRRGTSLEDAFLEMTGRG
jgi:ABC-type multidrug transport system ATPase subunit